MRRSLTFAAVVFLGGAVVMAQSDTPQLRQQGTATQLVVDGGPSLIRGGELGSIQRVRLYRYR